MKATFFILATLAFSASAMFTPPKQHDCTKCYNDILTAIEDCTIDGQDTHEILVCVETVLETSADCLVCVCDVLGILGGADASACDPAKLKELKQTRPWQ